jgi:putative tricarboxylic transport membrane protein
MSSPQNSNTVSTRWPELVVALLLLAVALLVIKDSLRVGIGWADDGPRSGYFPFYIGVGLLGASAWIAFSQLRQWRSSTGSVFAEKSQLALVWAIFWPMVIYVALVAWLGIYLASFILIAYFMFRHGKHKLPLTLGVAVGVPLVFFWVFEKWFLVLLPKGPVEALLGL